MNEVTVSLSYSIKQSLINAFRLKSPNLYEHHSRTENCESFGIFFDNLGETLLELNINVNTIEMLLLLNTDSYGKTVADTKLMVLSDIRDRIRIEINLLASYVEDMKQKLDKGVVENRDSNFYSDINERLNIYNTICEEYGENVWEPESGFEIMVFKGEVFKVVISDESDEKLRQDANNLDERLKECVFVPTEQSMINRIMEMKAKLNLHRK